MADVEVYRYAKGPRGKVEKIVAQHAEVQAYLTAKALERATIAEGILDRSPGRTGDSSIEVDAGRIDRYVVLNDERGSSAALAIEHGHYRTLADGSRTWIPGPAPLHGAFPELGKG